MNDGQDGKDDKAVQATSSKLKQLSVIGGLKRKTPSFADSVSQVELSTGRTSLLGDLAYSCGIFSVIHRAFHNFDLDNGN